jgi:hypothetical protein
MRGWSMAQKGGRWRSRYEQFVVLQRAQNGFLGFGMAWWVGHEIMTWRAEPCSMHSMMSFLFPLISRGSRPCNLREQ